MSWLARCQMSEIRGRKKAGPSNARPDGLISVIRPPSSARLHLGDRLRHHVVHGAADLVVGLGHALGVEILAQLVEHAGALDVREHHLLGVGLGVGAGEAELLGGPQPGELVAPRGRLEPQLLVMRELLLEPFLALVERGHAGPRCREHVPTPKERTCSRGLAYRGKMAKSTWVRPAARARTALRAGRGRRRRP